MGYGAEMDPNPTVCRHGHGDKVVSPNSYKPYLRTGHSQRLSQRHSTLYQTPNSTSSSPPLPSPLKTSSFGGISGSTTAPRASPHMSRASTRRLSAFWVHPQTGGEWIHHTLSPSPNYPPRPVAFRGPSHCLPPALFPHCKNGSTALSW